MIDLPFIVVCGLVAWVTLFAWRARIDAFTGRLPKTPPSGTGKAYWTELLLWRAWTDRLAGPLVIGAAVLAAVLRGLFGPTTPMGVALAVMLSAMAVWLWVRIEILYRKMKGTQRRRRAREAREDAGGG